MYMYDAVDEGVRQEADPLVLLRGDGVAVRVHPRDLRPRGVPTVSFQKLMLVFAA